ncbi:MAG: hypothetical protein Fur0014_14870 [Rubrivivax sp.]
MTPSAIAAAVPAPSPSPTPFLERLRPRRAHVAAGLGLGVGFALLVDGVPVGLGLALVTIATTISVIAAAGREGWQSAKGHRWLLVTAALLFSCGAVQDAALHLVFVGFVLSMVFGHAPIVFPAVLRVPLTFHRGLWAPLLLLHATLALRVAGPALQAPALARWGALGGAAAVGLFVAALLAGAPGLPQFLNRFKDGRGAAP